MGDDPSNRVWRITADGKVYRRGLKVYANRDEYEGEFVDGMRHGRGVMTFVNGDRYEGEFENNAYHGFGIYMFAPFQDPNAEEGANSYIIGRRYEGEWKDGLRHGKGCYMSGDGDVYTGYFEKGQYHGQGVLRLKNGDTFTGEFFRGKAGGGKVKCVYTNGDYYQGYMLSGLYHGKGLLKYAREMGSYEGDFLRGKRHGKGIRVYANGNKYTGDFFEGQMCGDGIMFYANGDQYIGKWVDGKMHGTGIIKYSSGDRYEGGWMNGFPYGEGKYQYSDGGYYMGEFKAVYRSKLSDEGATFPQPDGLRHGFGVRVWSNGNRYEGMWSGGVMDGRGEMVSVGGGRYTGGFWNSLKHGEGSEDFGNLLNVEYSCPLGHKHKGQGYCHYDGQYFRGAFHGKGKFVCQDGRLYEGFWKHGKQHGFGRKTYLQKGEEGDPARLFYGGVGSLYRTREYEGEWVENIREGKGKLVYVNGDTIEGNFKGGLPDGVVTYTFAEQEFENRYIKVVKKKRLAIYERGSRVKWIKKKDEIKYKAMNMFEEEGGERALLRRLEYG